MRFALMTDAKIMLTDSAVLATSQEDRIASFGRDAFHSASMAFEDSRTDA